MQAKLPPRPELLLLLSLLLVILLNPVMDHGGWRLPVLAVLMFIPVTLATLKLSQLKVWVWPAVLLMFGNLIFLLASNIFRNKILDGIRWLFLAAFFALAAVGLFSYLKNSRLIKASHLFTAVNIYLLLGMLWASIYGAMEAFFPGSIQLGNHPTGRQSELLYFSLVTLSTIGYGDVVPVGGETRMLAALEGVTGVLYVAITVAILVGRFEHELLDDSDGK
jgi:Ion channel